jgi:hypothetical protein
MFHGHPKFSDKQNSAIVLFFITEDKSLMEKGGEALSKKFMKPI